MTQIIPDFLKLTTENPFLTLMCPTSAKHTKIINRFIKILFDSRDKIDNGQEPNNIFLNI